MGTYTGQGAPTLSEEQFGGLQGWAEGVSAVELLFYLTSGKLLPFGCAGQIRRAFTFRASHAHAVICSSSPFYVCRENICCS